MKIYITTTAEIGARCAAWAMENLPPGVSFVENMEDSDIFFSIFYNKLISEEFIAGRKKCLNFHGGILPEYRGSGTINWAIINGEKETGITLHEIDAQIDHGPVIDIQRIPIEDTDTAGTLYVKLEELIFQMFKSWFARLISLDYIATPQDHSRAKLYFRKDLQAAKDLTRFVRAFEYPGKENAYYLTNTGEVVPLKYEPNKAST